MTELEELAQLIRQYPDALRQLMRDAPEKVRPVLLMVKAVEAREFTLDGFKAYYWCLFDRELPKHAEAWVEAFFEEWHSGKDPRGLMVKAFRGATKSTVLAVLCTFITSHHPVRSGLIVQKNENDAKDMASFIADIFEFNAGQKACFPNIIPDKPRGWGVDSGYHLNNTNHEHDQWVQLCMQDHARDPSIIVASVSSGAIGKHPSGWLLLDDIHDFKNTESKAEMAKVVNTVKADILPTLVRKGNKPFVLWAYTPWDEKDAYSVVEKSGMFRMVSTPAFTKDANGQDSFDGEAGYYTWKDLLDEDKLKAWRTTLGIREFRRMFMCSLEGANSGSLVYYPYDFTLVSPDWPMVGGVDPTNVDKPVGEGGERSHFALAFLARIPNGGAVITDGVLRQCSQLEAEAHILDAQSRYPHWKYTAVENVGGGAGFIQSIRRNNKIRIVASDLAPMDIETKRPRNKKARLEKELGPWLENGTIRISNARTPFLDALRRGCEQFFDLPKEDYAFDAWDAVYHAVKMMPEVLVIPSIGEQLPTRYKKVRAASPLAGLSGYRGY